jgi:hypothetical protein
MKRYFLFVLLSASAVCSEAVIWDLDLIGRSEDGALTGGNEVPAVDTPARGGELSNFNPGNPGLQYDDQINQLAVRVDFGHTGVGYAADLEGTFTGAHIHGPADINTASPNILHSLDGITSLQAGGRSGTISGFVTLTDAEETMLFNRLLYINIHSTVNPDGEIRGNLMTAIPEPEIYGLAGASALLAFAGCRRWKTASIA